MESAFSLCLEQVRAGDHDRYLTLLYAPADKRPALAALYACHLELAAVRDKVSEPMLGVIRYQWWRETLEQAAAGQPRQHPVAQAMAQVLRQHGDIAPLLDEAIEARITALEAQEPRSASALLPLADGAGGTVQVAALRILGGPATAEATARAIGAAAFLAGVRRGVMAEADRFTREAHDNLAQALRDEGLKLLAGVGRLPARGRSALLLAPLARDRLTRAAVSGEAGAVTRQLKLAWAAATGRW